jgi:hypothetical protein
MGAGTSTMLCAEGAGPGVCSSPTAGLAVGRAAPLLTQAMAAAVMTLRRSTGTIAVLDFIVTCSRGYTVSHLLHNDEA